jgi:hypothetical protein
MKKVTTLLAKVKNLILQGEYRSVKVHKVSCTRADLEFIQDFCEKLLRGETNLKGRYIISREVQNVFENAGIEI